MIEETDEALTVIARCIRTAEENIATVRELIASLKGEKQPTQKLDSNGEPRWEYLVNVQIPADFYLTKEMREYARIKTNTQWLDARIETEFDKMREYYENVRNKPNGKWSHWRKVFYKWVRSTYERETNGNSRPPNRFNRAAIRE